MIFKKLPKGAHVVAVSRTAADLEKLKQELGNNITAITLDIGNEKKNTKKTDIKKRL